MNSELRKILSECIADMEHGAGVEDCLKRNPGKAAALRPHLEMWATLGGASLVQPPRTAFNRGRREMLSALRETPAGFRPLTAGRFAPAWATVAAAVVGLVVLLGGAAGTSAALGGPDVPGSVFDAVGVTGDENGGGISQSSASERGLECASPNAFEGSGNSEDKAKNADDAHEKESCNEDECETADADGAEVEETDADGAETEDAADDEGDAEADCPESDEAVDEDADATVDGCEDENKGHGNDADHDDEDNPGQGQGNHGAEADDTGDECPAVDDAVDDGQTEDEDENNGHGNDADHDDEGNPGQGEGNHGADDGEAENSNANADDSANGDGPSGQGADKKTD